MKRAGLHCVPREGQKSKLRSKAEGAGPALKTKGWCVGSGG